jgi:hypothetical protein
VNAVGALLLTLATAASHETWVATVQGPPAAAGLICRIFSAAAVPRRVRVESFAADGTPVFDSGRFLLAPEAVFQSGVGAAGRVCRFELEDGRDLRAEALVFDAPAQRFTAIPARRSRGR